MNLIQKTTPMATMGSCFAVALTRRFEKQGYNLTITSRMHGGRLNWYNTYSLRYEFEKAFAGMVADPEDIWDCRRGNGGWWFQDPLRRLVRRKTKPHLAKYVRGLDTQLANALKTSDVFLLTLGLSEAWKLKKSGLIACHHPLYGYTSRKGTMKAKSFSGRKSTEFYDMTTQENIDNLDRIATLIRDHRPGAHLILTVSPVPLQKTFTKLPLAEANAISKQKLVDAVPVVLERFPETVHYFDSYEYCRSLPKEKCYAKDGRHIKPKVVDKNIKRFEEMFVGLD
jgi:hypothetical protein